MCRVALASTITHGIHMTDARTGEAMSARDPRCLGCDYVLDGLVESRCPECGRSFDPQDPCTFYTGSRLEKWVRRWSEPPRKTLNRCACAVAALYLIQSALPGGLSVVPLLCISVGALLICIWLFRFLMRFVLRRKHGCALQSPKRWLVIPTACAVIALSSAVQFPLRVGFWLSRPSMDALASEVASSPASSFEPRWVGIYRVQQITRISSGVLLRVAGAGFMDTLGFAHSSSGMPPTLFGEEFSPLSSGWFVWRRESSFGKARE